MANLTALEKYQIIFGNLTKQEAPLTLEQALVFQELLYRMEVLQVCQMYISSASALGDIYAMITHYQMVDAYLENLKTERRNGLIASENEQKRRDTAYQNLCRIVSDYRKRFAGFKPADPHQYKSEIGKAITVFLPAWIQLRNVYVQINAAVPKSEPQNPQSPKEAPPEDEFAKALKTPCPIQKYSGKTLGDLLNSGESRALVWIAEKYTKDPEISAAAKLICEKSLEQSA